MKFKRIYISTGLPKPIQRFFRKNAAQEILKTTKQNKDIVISVSHDDYTRVAGGIQNILGDEQRELQKSGIPYLHLCPTLSLRGLSQVTEPADFKFLIRLNGRPLGILDGQALQEVLARLEEQGSTPHWILHHLMGHSPEVLQKLLAHGASRPLLWTHDYFAACSSYTLMRDDSSYCAAPSLPSEACSSCKYGEDRPNHVIRIQQFINQIQPTIVAPSEFALQQWAKATGLPLADSAIIPPVQLSLEKKNRKALRRKLRIAYIGRQDSHKGWNIFYKLAEEFCNDSRYKFFQFGKAPKGIFKRFSRTVRNVPVAVDARHRHAMVEALKRHKIDAVVCWSLWPETFNITVHEAMASGAFIIARRKQGNVWLAASHHAPLASRALDGDVDLHAYFKTGQLYADLEKSPRYYGKAEPSTGSAALLFEPRGPH